ncbi:enoyl-CoA hydratase [Nonlabens sp. Hel1_33_55]|uniref:enoyl-CoA hydratase/isomerase family protein n=1 Tax=Nonlabens sp. Hel1_33_55 TaxID=1336802 RepID=UPI000875CB53|nr:enoyl-CoA hydratase-related protein [Nonlabens sp. Hel1_33_55]SCY31032.1 enoyl-CoA hydratase [Nonlabens sp. Hel1_33_55]
MNNIQVDIDNRIATITIDRPKKLNALNRETIEELGTAFADLEENEDVRVIVITGSGEKAFVAGADISEFADYDEMEGKKLAGRGQQELFDVVENCATPVIAAVNGFALGGGLELAMAAHFRVASDNARLGLPETSLGVIPGYGGTQRLPQLVGKGRAMEMIMTAGMIDANQALTYGLVNHVVAQEELLDFTYDLARKVIKNSPMAVAAAIDAVNAGYTDGTDGYQVEIDNFGSCFGTEEFVEGTTAFLEKRKAEF